MPAQLGRCAACSWGDSSALLYGAPHASRPRGPSNWLQDRRTGGRAGGRAEGRGGGRPASPHPARRPGGSPAIPRPARCRLRGPRADRPGGCASRSRWVVALGQALPSAAGLRKSQSWDTEPGQGAGCRDRSSSQLSPRSRAGLHLPRPLPTADPHFPNFGPRAAEVGSCGFW